ncbi:hypothetical protein BpHYR1_026647 [Brachionus plicatilis]|uniref:Uncharacterized protein n=1 Tax=Brachionus plicatilis TaxID=10195 RepID=A0A3M7RMC7_BRAPC|nr:hypothetical protein BpHYR1_026647 [Brachionus plicatilis]
MGSSFKLIVTKSYTEIFTNRFENTSHSAKTICVAVDESFNASVVENSVLLVGEGLKSGIEKGSLDVKMLGTENGSLDVRKSFVVMSF